MGYYNTLSGEWRAWWIYIYVITRNNLVILFQPNCDCCSIGQRTRTATANGCVSVVIEYQYNIYSWMLISRDDDEPIGG